MLATQLIDRAINEHVEWLNEFGETRIKHFRKILKSNRQGAVCEALVAKYLCAQIDDVQPFEDLSSGGPDFVCKQSGQKFYIEVTCLDTEAVARASWIPDDPHWMGGSVGSLSKLIRTAVCSKVRQCARVEDAPTLIALGTLHFWVSNAIDRSLADDLLVSDVSYVVPIVSDPPGLSNQGDMVTGLKNALFMEIADGSLTDKRQPVSGVVVFGLGVDPPQVIGVVNGHAHRPFEVQLLPAIPFAEAAIEDDDRVAIHWLDK